MKQRVLFSAIIVCILSAIYPLSTLAANNNLQIKSISSNLEAFEKDADGKYKYVIYNNLEANIFRIPYIRVGKSSQLGGISMTFRHIYFPIESIARLLGGDISYNDMSSPFSGTLVCRINELCEFVTEFNLCEAKDGGLQLCTIYTSEKDGSRKELSEGLKKALYEDGYMEIIRYKGLILVNADDFLTFSCMRQIDCEIGKDVNKLFEITKIRREEQERLTVSENAEEVEQTL